MARHLFKIFVAALLFWGCERNDLITDPDYPATYYKIPAATLTQMRTALLTEYKYLRSDLNDFGFCYLPENYITTKPPEIPNILTETEVKAIANSFIVAHPDETGIENPGEVTYSKSHSLPGGTDWSVVTSLQKADTAEVLNSDLILRIKNGVLVSCSGNRYPEIHIPDNFKFSIDKAKIHIIGKEVTHYNVGGEKYYVTISKSDLEGSTAGLKIVPVKSADKIELRVTWMINIPGPVFCKVYVDVMTGEIIREDPTIIS